jgi:glycosyltransferase involved in cell wall biosynthesis
VRILLATRNYGGPGGIQRHVASTIRCLGPRHEIDVYASVHEPGEYGARPTIGRVRSVPIDPRLHAVWSAWDRVKRVRRRARYDVYLHYQYARWVGSGSAVSFAIPCGRSLQRHEARLDAVLLEAPDNAQWVSDQTKAVLLPPPLEPPSATAEPVGDVPEQFFLTVFNSHNRGKGLDDLAAAAARSPIPIVWCRSTLWRHPDPCSMPGVVVREDLTQAQLRGLYERCRAYVSFDRNPGFGWSLADALQYGAPAVTRPHGVMTLPDLDTRATWTYGTTDELVDVLHGGDFAHVQRDLSTLSPQRFVERFEDLVRSWAGR